MPKWGFSSSPILRDGMVVIQADVQKDSFLAAFDATSGKELWRTARKDVPTFELRRSRLTRLTGRDRRR